MVSVQQRGGRRGGCCCNGCGGGWVLASRHTPAVPLSPHRVQVRDLTPPVVMACGGTAGVLYWLAIFPVSLSVSAQQQGSCRSWGGRRACESSIRCTRTELWQGKQQHKQQHAVLCVFFYSKTSSPPPPGAAEPAAAAALQQQQQQWTVSRAATRPSPQPSLMGSLPLPSLCISAGRRGQVCHDDRQHRPQAAAIPQHDHGLQGAQQDMWVGG